MGARIRRHVETWKQGHMYRNQQTVGVHERYVLWKVKLERYPQLDCSDHRHRSKRPGSCSVVKNLKSGLRGRDVAICAVCRDLVPGFTPTVSGVTLSGVDFQYSSPTSFPLWPLGGLASPDIRKVLSADLIFKLPQPEDWNIEYDGKISTSAYPHRNLSMPQFTQL